MFIDPLHPQFFLFFQIDSAENRTQPLLSGNRLRVKPFPTRRVSIWA